jgi:hypothetical protein
MSNSLLEINIDQKRWDARVDRYLNTDVKILTAATEMTEEATAEGINIARSMIDEYVYNQYQPAEYQRTMTLQEAPQIKNKIGLGIASGEIYISQGVLNSNVEGNPKGKPYGIFTEKGVDSPGPGHFARLFWAHTFLELEKLLFDDLAPAALKSVLESLVDEAEEG